MTEDVLDIVQFAFNHLGLGLSANHDRRYTQFVQAQPGKTNQGIRYGDDSCLAEACTLTQSVRIFFILEICPDFPKEAKALIKSFSLPGAVERK